MGFDDRTPAARPTSSLRLHRARDVLGRELAAILRPDVADRILTESFAEAAVDNGSDPAARLRCLVGARLLEAVSDLLSRTAKEETPFARPAVAEREPSPPDVTRCVSVGRSG